MLLGSRAAFTPVLLTCYAITLAVHVSSIALSTLLPFRMVEVGGSGTQVGLLFSVMTLVSIVLRPTIGGWVSRDKSPCDPARGREHDSPRRAP